MQSSVEGMAMTDQHQRTKGYYISKLIFLRSIGVGQMVSIEGITMKLLKLFVDGIAMQSSVEGITIQSVVEGVHCTPCRRIDNVRPTPRSMMEVPV